MGNCTLNQTYGWSNTLGMLLDEIKQEMSS